MELVCLGSSSSGNCYLLRTASETLVLECGVDMHLVKQALGWSFANVVGCLVTHEHKDHSKHIRDFMQLGVKVLALPEVFDSQRIRSPFCTPIQPLHGYKLGGFKIFALPAEHDVPCLGFVIEHPEMGKTLFLTDTMMLEYRIGDLNHIMIECNYSDDILRENIDNGIVPPAMRDRLVKTHMELKTTEGILKATNLADVNEVVLLHLSHQNSNPTHFRARVEETIGKPVYIARNGLKIDFSKDPY